MMNTPIRHLFLSKAVCLATLNLALVISLVGCQGSDSGKQGGITIGQVDADAPKELTATPSGLKYRILRKATGKKPTAQQSVTVHYEGKLDDGTVFDSSYARGEPITFPLNRVIAGWTEGLQLVNEGGMIELEIPSELGYGAGGAGDIPPHATLHFKVELLKVVD